MSKPLHPTKLHMKQYLKHPIISNPVKWVPSIEKFHAPQLYQQNRCQESLEANPFAKSLVRTHKDTTSFRFPNGSLIRLIVEADRNNGGSYVLVPSYDEPDHKQIVAPSYILGNRNYMKYIHLKGWWMRYLSLKYRNKTDNKILRMTRVMENLSEKYQEDLQDRVKAGLKLIDSNNKNINDHNLGIKLSSSGDLIQVNEKMAIINIPSINHEGEIFIPFKGNEPLCYDIIRLMRYYL